MHLKLSKNVPCNSVNPQVKTQARRLPPHFTDTFLDFEYQLHLNDFRSAFEYACLIFREILFRGGCSERAFHRILEIVRGYDEEIENTVQAVYPGCFRDYEFLTSLRLGYLPLDSSTNFCEVFDYLFDLYKHHLSKDGNYERAVYRIVEKIRQYDSFLGNKMRVLLTRNIKDRGLHRL